MRYPTRASVALSVALFGACAIPVTYFIGQERENRTIERIQALRKERVEDISSALRTVCEENNQQNAILSGLLEAALAPEGDDDPPSPRFEEESRRAFAALRPTDCRRLPALRPFRG